MRLLIASALAGALARALIVALLMIAIITGVAYWCVTSARAPIIRHTAEAVHSGALLRQAWLPLWHGDPIDVYGLNDCLILSMLELAPRDGAFPSALSPLIPVPTDVGTTVSSVPATAQCHDLTRVVASAGDSVDANAVTYYHRYIHGYRALLGLALAMMPFATASALMLAVLSALLLALGIGAIRQWTTVPRRATGYMAIAASLLLCGGLPVFGWSFSYAPADIVLVLFLLYSQHAPLTEQRETTLILVLSLLGAATASLDFLTGALPASFCAFLLALSFDAPTVALAQRRLLLGTLAFVGGAIGIFALKLTAAAVIWGPSVFTNFTDQLGAHMGSETILAPNEAAQLAPYGLTAERFTHSRLLRTLYAGVKILYYTPIVTWGSRAVGIFLFAGGLVLGSVALLFPRQGALGLSPMRRPMLALAFCVIPGWYLLFPGHTIQHALFMVRVLVWPLVAGGLLFASRLPGAALQRHT